MSTHALPLEITKYQILCLFVLLKKKGFHNKYICEPEIALCLHIEIYWSTSDGSQCESTCT